MPKGAQYTVSWSPERGEYLIPGLEPAVSGQLAPTWLGTHRAFAFHGRNGQINLLKERRRRGGDGYWYAYRRYQGKIYKRYLGRDEQVSLEQLEEIAALLAREPASEMPKITAPHASDNRGIETVRDTSTLPGERSGELARRVGRAEVSPGESGPSGKALFVEPLLMSKLQLPRPQKKLLSRENLLKLLDQGLEHKITLLSGPAGYGKTTLIAQWIAARCNQADFLRVAGVTLDESDNDPLRFWRYVVAACQKFAPGLGEEALSLLFASRFLVWQRNPLERMLIALLNELSQLEQPGVLILDDLHVISSPQVIESLNFFLEHLPATLHLILLLRGDLPFALMRLRARNELLDIPPSYLPFSLEETRLFFAQEFSFALSPRITRQLHERLEGWPAGFRLFSQVLVRSQSEQEIAQVLATFAGNHWSLRAYFLSEVFSALPVEQQEFLLQTSILPRVSPELCQVLTGREDSAELIETLRSGDFFLIPLDGSGEWLRYQSLFAAVMQKEARQRLGDARLNQLAIQASIWYEQHGLLSEAIETALSAADFARVTGLIARFMETRRRQGVFVFLELYNLKRWLEGLPEQELERNPDFCLHYAMILLFTLGEEPRVLNGRERIYHLLSVAEQQWRDANDTAKLAEVFAFRALLARQEGRILQALTWARQALAWLLKEDFVWRTIALTVVGMGEVVSGELVQAREFFLEAQALNEQIGNTAYGRATRGMLGWVYLEQGELRRAAEQFRQMQAEARAQEDHDDITRTQLGLAQLLYEWNKLEEAEQAAREAYALSEQMGEEELLATSTIRLARIEQARGRTEQAQQRLTAWLARGLVPVTPQSYQFYRDVQVALAQIQLASGDLEAVKRWSAGLEQRAEILPLYQRQREQLLVARLLIAQGEYVRAIEQLELLAVNTRQTGHLTFCLHVQVVLALAYARGGERARVHKLLSEVLAMARSEGYLRLFLDEGEQMAALLHELLPLLREERALAVYTRDILAAFAGESVEIPAEHARLVDPLSPQERKVLRLLVRGNSNAEIARELVVSINTVRSQVQSIYRKLDVNNRVQASAVARQMQLL